MVPKVSVIIPIYNVQDSLERCLDSVINQRLKEIEIILINDGSIDLSKQICEKYSKIDNRINLINTINNGQSVARNIGINIAKGKYIAFFDSDDWVDSEMLYELYNKSEEKNIDIAVCGIKIDYENENYAIINSLNNSQYLFQKEMIANSVFHISDKGLLNSPCNKLYKRKIINEYNIKFDKKVMPVEDIIFNIEYFEKIQSLYISEKSFYHYVKRNVESTVTKYCENIYQYSKLRYKGFKHLFTYYKLNEEEHKEWLNTQYIYGISDCIINMYRYGSKLDFRNKYYFLKEIIFKDNICIDIFKENNNYKKNIDSINRIFILCFKIKSPLITICIYDLLFKLKKNLKTIYFYYRKYINCKRGSL